MPDFLFFSSPMALATSSSVKRRFCNMGGESEDWICDLREFLVAEELDERLLRTSANLEANRVEICWISDALSMLGAEDFLTWFNPLTSDQNLFLYLLEKAEASFSHTRKSLLCFRL